MLVYEKKVDNTRHLYGKVEGTVPAVDDVQLTYKDAEGNTLTIQEKDTYKDDGKGGIYRVSDKKAVNVFIGNTQIIGEEPEESTPAEITLTAIEVTAPTKTNYFEGDPLDLTGMVVKEVYSDDTKEEIATGFTVSPENGATLTEDVSIVTVTHTASELTDTFEITVTPANNEGSGGGE
jgi:hypothetical protein